MWGGALGLNVGLVSCEHGSICGGRHHHRPSHVPPWGLGFTLAEDVAVPVFVASLCAVGPALSRVAAQAGVLPAQAAAAFQFVVGPALDKMIGLIEQVLEVVAPRVLVSEKNLRKIKIKNGLVEVAQRGTPK